MSVGGDYQQAAVMQRAWRTLAYPPLSHKLLLHGRGLPVFWPEGVGGQISLGTCDAMGRSGMGRGRGWDEMEWHGGWDGMLMRCDSEGVVRIH